MAVFKCKMCGGSLEVQEGMTVCECEYCGTTQTVPTAKDEALQTLFNRANVLRMKSEFDKAADIYEKILQKSDTEAEAYWGLILCKYGIEYVEDPTTFKRIPTCHRASYDAVVADEDYQNAIKYADISQRSIYEIQAAEIDEIQKGIIAIAQKEDPYDVFICYKETDEAGQRTVDSVIANDIYHQLVTAGYKVFYAAITLEDKLGKEYEPYIFSALNTSKVMLTLGTKPEYFNAVWVKNEWSRFLKIMKKDRSRLLIPCYRDMDPYELPEEFAHLQAQDMGKIGFINDLIRGIKKVIPKESAKAQKQSSVQQVVTGTTATAQIKRGNMALEDQEWAKADTFFEEALNIDPECAEAYLGQLLAKNKKKNWNNWVDSQVLECERATTRRLIACDKVTLHIEVMANKYEIVRYLSKAEIQKLYEYDCGYDSVLQCREQQKEKQLKKLSNERLLQRARQYATGETAKKIENGIAKITGVLDQRISNAKKEDAASIENVKKAYKAHIEQADLRVVERHKDSSDKREKDYQSAVDKMNSANSIESYTEAMNGLMKFPNYKDTEQLVEDCQKEIYRLAEDRRREEKQLREKKEAASRKRKVIIGSIIVIAILGVVAYASYSAFAISNNKYKDAVILKQEKEYDKAKAAFEELGGFRDSAEQVKECEFFIYEDDYNKALSYKEKGKYEGAIRLFTRLGDYKDSVEQLEACETAIKDKEYDAAVKLMEKGDYKAAITAFEEMNGYRDSTEQIVACETAIKDNKDK